MLGALSKGKNYYAVDADSKLVEHLNEMYNDINMIFKPHAEVKCVSSEVWQREWKGMMNFMLTSPPYYRLEEYPFGGTTSYNSLYDWTYGFLLNTLRNVKDYVKGKVLITIRNYKKYDLISATKHAGRVAGLKYIETTVYESGSRPTKGGDFIDSNDSVIVFEAK